MSDQDPAVGAWQAATERSYAESTRSTLAHARRLEEQLDQARRDYNAELAARVEAERERDTIRQAADRNLERLAYARGELGKARAEVERLRLQSRPWMVARDGGRDCESCDQEIRRGEAYQHLGVDELRHVHCPRPRKHLDAVKRERDDALAEVSRLRASNQTETTDG